MTKSRIHAPVSLLDVVVLCAAPLKRSTCLAAYVWRAIVSFFPSAPKSVYRKELCLTSPPSRGVSWPFPTQRPVWPNSYQPSFFFNKSDFKCLAFQTGCRSALCSQTGPHRARPNATPCRAWSHERGPKPGPLENRPTHMRCITSQPENK